MKTADRLRPAARRAARMGLAGAALLAAVHGAAASDGGIGDFFASIFGAPQAAPQAAPPAYAPRIYAPYAPRLRRPHPRPLTVRLHPAKPRLVAEAPAKPPGKVSIYEDRTLRRGDAVMTARGVRVFAGSDAFPYTAADFVSLKDAPAMDRDASKVLAQLDRAPRG